MITIKQTVKTLGLLSVLTASALSLPGLAQAGAFDGGIPASWTCVGNCGTLGPDGVVTSSPEGGKYGYIASNTGITGLGLAGIGGTDGSRLRSDVFSAAAGDDLEFYFNYVTSDGAGYADYAWVRLLNSDLSEAALLFTARTTPGGNTVPGFALPALNPSVTLDPATTPIIAGAPTWSPLGGYSGRCWSTGCGYTNWIKMSYDIAAAGDYVLEFGVVDWTDQIYDSGLAFDNVLVGGKPIDQQGVPEPATLALLGLGLAGIGFMRRKARG
ncbi:MAG: NF038132 family protein [Thiobacillaceae bacterium]